MTKRARSRKMDGAHVTGHDGSEQENSSQDSRSGPTGILPVDYVYQTLRSQILSGGLQAGTRLVEESTARLLGVSRTPVRDAIFRLETERLVTRDARGGTVVASLTPEEIEDIYAVRSSLEGLAARLAVRTMSPRDHLRLEHVQAKLEEATEQERFDDLTVLDLHFHDVILRSTRNQTLISFMEQLHTGLSRVDASTLAYPGRAAEAMREHRSLIAALKSGNARQAEQVARKHMDNALDIRLMMNLSEEIESLDLEEFAKLKAKAIKNKHVGTRG